MTDSRREPVTEKGSPPIYKIKAETDFYVTMRDGVRLAVNIYRPDAEGKFPALLALSPYGKEVQSLPIPPQPVGSLYWRGSLEAGNTEYLVSRGYAHIIADTRGSGQSEGESRNILSKQEAEDGYDLVEWIAQQPWCDGNIGMIGISYFGVEQLIVAAEQPPHLKAIFPYDSPGDFYRDGVYDGGILSMFWGTIYPFMSARNFVSDAIKNVPSAELDRLIQEAKDNPDIKYNAPLYNILLNPKINPIIFDFLVHPTDGPFYWERSAYKKYDKIKIPVYLGSGWYAYTYTHLTGAFRHYAGINAPKKLILLPPVFLERPFYQLHDLIIRWYDYWLKGIDTGIMDEPPIKVFVMGANQFRYEQEWPLARTKWTKFYLHSWGRLLPEPEPFADCPPDAYVQQAPTVTNKIQSVVFQTPPLPEDTEVTGPIASKLYASIDTDDTNWIVSLKDVSINGSETELTRGWLKASHRALDETKSKPWQPYHLHTKEVIEKIQPGEIYEYDIEIRPTSNLFKAGHRIKLEIQSMDVPSPIIFVPCHLPGNRTTLHKIYHDKKHQSYLLLPIVPPKKG